MEPNLIAKISTKIVFDDRACALIPSKISPSQFLATAANPTRFELLEKEPSRLIFMTLGGGGDQCRHVGKNPTRYGPSV